MPDAATGEGLTPAEVHVLRESDGHATLWGLAASWTGNGDDNARADSVPMLREAVVTLVRRGLVEVFAFSTWPPDWDNAVPAQPADVPSLIKEVEKWLWRGEDTCLVTVSATEAGVNWL